MGTEEHKAAYRHNIAIVDAVAQLDAHMVAAGESM